MRANAPEGGAPGEEASKMTSPDKPGSASFTQMTELVLPVHANHMQTMFGGTPPFFFMPTI